MLKGPSKIVTPGRLFFSVVAARQALLCGLFCCAAVVAACEIGVPWLVQEAVDAALGYQDSARIDVIGIWMLAVMGALYAAHCLLLRLEARILYDGLFRLRQRLYTALLRQPLSYFSQAKVGELTHRVINDTDVFEDNAAEIFSDIPFELLTIAGVVALMVLTDLRLAGVVILFLTIASVISSYLGRPLPTLRKALQSVGASFSARLQEALAGIRTVKTFGRERFEMNRLDEANGQFLNLDLCGARLSAFLDPVFDLMESLGVVLVVWYGAHLIIAKQITPGGLVAFLAYMEILAGPVSRIDRYYGHFQKCRGVCQRLAEFLSDLESALEPPRASLPIELPAEPWSIRFDDVSFSYSGSNRFALHAFSLTIEPGQVIALVGRNGAGKSTLLDLLLRFYDPTSGKILVGGSDLLNCPVESWREVVGLMTQEVFLFHASIAENIAYAKPTALPSEVEACATQAGLGDLLRRLPQGLQTMVGDRGSKLSGGERQRIALARLLLKNPKILVFDEPTAHLDGEALRDWSESVRRLSDGRTTLVVTHHAAIARLADRVVLIDNGRIVADGTHDEMLAQNALYASLFAPRVKDKKTGELNAGLSVRSSAA